MSVTTATTTASARDGLVHSYLFLRRAIGLIGMALPIVLIIGNLAWPPGHLLDSISSAYYSPLHGVFVGAVVALGVFLLSYRGYALVDDVIGDVAAGGAIGLALFPTAPDSGAANHAQAVASDLHAVFSGVFFVSLVVFCLFLFPKTAPDAPPTARKLQRNTVYRVTGIVILVSIVLLGLAKVTRALPALHPMLWLETIAILAFGVAWAVKGETLLRD